MRRDESWPGWLKEMDQRTASCRSCDQVIRWGTTQKGKKVPMDLEPGPDGKLVSHFSTCPNADSHRRRA